MWLASTARIFYSELRSQAGWLLVDLMNLGRMELLYAAEGWVDVDEISRVVGVRWHGGMLKMCSTRWFEEE